MNGTTALRSAGQHLWLDTISRRLLDSGTLQRYIDEYGITGVTSNPTILAREIAGSDQYDAALAATLEERMPDPEQIVYQWAIADAQCAADLLRPTWEATSGLDGWVSIEIPPALAYQAQPSIRWGRQLHQRIQRPNVFIKVPATWQGLRTIEELIAAGVPVNATLIFDAPQHRLVEESYMRGLKRRRVRGLTLRVASVASTFVSRWDQAANPFLPQSRHNRIGLAIAREVQDDHRLALGTWQWAQLAAGGADPQRLVWASTSTKDPALPPTYYAARLPLTGTINTMPESTLLTLGRTDLVNPDKGSTEAANTVLAEFGIDQHRFADALLHQGVRIFATDWARLLESIRMKAVAATRSSAHVDVA